MIKISLITICLIMGSLVFAQNANIGNDPNNPTLVPSSDPKGTEAGSSAPDYGCKAIQSCPTCLANAVAAGICTGDRGAVKGEALANLPGAAPAGSQ